jgi:hypothetical protein
MQGTGSTHRDLSAPAFKTIRHMVFGTDCQVRSLLAVVAPLGAPPVERQTGSVWTMSYCGHVALLNCGARHLSIQDSIDRVSGSPVATYPRRGAST